MSWLRPDFGSGVQALVTNRQHPKAVEEDEGGGESEFNVAVHAGRQDDVAENRVTVTEVLGAHSIQWLNQVHGAEVKYIDEVQSGHLECDATWTDQKGIGLAIMTADCVPVLIADDTASVVGAAHAGWQGLEARIVSALIHAMPVAPSRLKAYVGPAISCEHYEVGADVWERFPPEFQRPHPMEDKRYLDLVGMVVAELKTIGVTVVETSGECCFANAAFYSHRASMQKKRPEGRFVSAICLL